MYVISKCEEMQNSQKYLEFSNTGEKKINASSPTLGKLCLVSGVGWQFTSGSPVAEDAAL